MDGNKSGNISGNTPASANRSAERGKEDRPVAVVTGVSRRIGIGAAICRALAAKNMDVMFTTWSAFDRAMPWGADEEGPDAIVRELTRSGIRCERLEIDQSDPGAAKRIIDETENRLGFPAVLVNNAAYSVNDGYEKLDAAVLDAHYAVNMRGTALLSVEFGRRFSRGSGGRIINMTSGQSLGPMRGEIAYAATKAAVEAMTVTLAAELAPKGITVNAVNPGPTDTGWMTEELRNELAGQFPFGRIGRPEDAARLIAFLAGEESEWITGQILHSEGGFRLK
ncbi:SDR family oxidoreductase [Paenibacillus sp. UNC499MF]|uniref:SDR family oxidoreductase n=1 Tax=Paenibacillus sp. UNC499MF TaxID=1502751 RepID=UPI0008A05BE1|nr:SDR family oxidoreductase [Paenibacillus sp. UNC499MF]SEF81795.1 3-oxoacyl-[acyl-carrier protein] reductase [Paenibacillus sp. UNC499MF]